MRRKTTCIVASRSATAILFRIKRMMGAAGSHRLRRSPTELKPLSRWQQMRIQMKEVCELYALAAAPDVKPLSRAAGET